MIRGALEQDPLTHPSAEAPEAAVPISPGRFPAQLPLPSYHWPAQAMAHLLQS
jgi:hypothetical protein